jgi:hypothetical protein
LPKLTIPLKLAEDKLLEFNKSYNIIKLLQSKSGCGSKEDMEAYKNKKKAQLAGTEASTKRLEEN